MPRYIATKDKLRAGPNPQAVPAIMVDGSRPREAAISAASKFEDLKYDDRIWLYPVGGGAPSQYAVCVELRIV